MNLVQRYIAAVQRELPEAKREEIGRELNANIMDQLDALREQQGNLEDAHIATVLKQMGHPRTVAQQFVPPQALISPGYMSLYRHTLFMVLGILFLLQVAGTTVEWLSSSQMGLFQYLRSLANGFLEDAMFAFSTITLGFWVMSRQQPNRQASCEQDWQPEQLPDAGPGWQHISLQDVFTDLATYLFLLVIIWYPLWLSPEQLANSRLIFNDSFYEFLRWASPLVLFGIVFSLLQLRRRFWNRALLGANIVLNSLFVLVILLLATNGPYLQENIEQWRGVFEPGKLERSVMITLVIIAMFPLWEVGRDLIRFNKLR
ncbi:MAG: hypothetical protein RQ757_01715 [Pseudomonadales bacterium]|nr:hypothetical protein [Pseudomonadales bacterium]